MKTDGKKLEQLVTFVEKRLLPQGFNVKANERVYNDDGVQIAEFDIEIRGKVGSTSIAWLIECRDRPSDGPAPGSWIEQLVGRRARFRFNKVTAVSTTGFARGAVEFARSEGIEVREVEALSPEQFADWLAISHIHHTEKVIMLQHAKIFVSEDENEDRKHALRQMISSPPAHDVILKSSKTGELVAPANAFSKAVQSQETLFEDLAPNGPGKKIRLYVEYTNDIDHFVVETTAGPIRVTAILFEGELRIKEFLVPLTVAAEYRDVENGHPISQMAAFAPQKVHGMKFSMEMHRMAESGETHIILRKLQNDA
jgi:hypothetical protein